MNLNASKNFTKPPYKRARGNSTPWALGFEYLNLCAASSAWVGCVDSELVKQMHDDDEIKHSHELFGRVIVHADLDCFYCQVEHVRLGIPMSTPLAVQQWNGLIAVNYEARKFGVRRGDRSEAAKQKCPQITLVHVETIAADSAVDGGEVEGVGVGGEDSIAEEEGRGQIASDATIAGTTIGTETRRRGGACKVSLERYRKASFAIMAIFQTHCRRVERASIDEAYLDLTEEVAKLCRQIENGKGQDLANAPEMDLQGTAGHRVDPTNAFDRSLLAGARLTAAMRKAVKDELGFTVSAGIASNKVLAKLASSRNKPNKQTVVPAGASSEMLDTVPIRKMRGLGRKLGDVVVSWSKAETASDLKRFSLDDLVGEFGPKTGGWLWRICRGTDDEAVTPNLRPKSLSVCKSFVPVRDVEAVLTWMTLLCKELAHRIRVDRNAWSRRVTKLTLQIISLQPGTRASQAGIAKKDGWKNATLTRSRTVDIPGGGEPPPMESLLSEAMAIFAKTEQALPCSRLALTAHDFTGLVSGRGSIASFLRVSSPPSPLLPSAPPTRRTSLFRSRTSEPLESNIPVRVESPFGGGRSSSSEVPARLSGRDGGVNVGSDQKETQSPRLGRSEPELDDDRGDIIGDWLKSGDAKMEPSGRERDPVSARMGKDGGKGCPKCGAKVAAAEMQEHLDFHYAEGLQERYSREGNVAREMEVKRKKPEAGDWEAKQRRRRQEGSATTRIDSFFKLS